MFSPRSTCVCLSSNNYSQCSRRYPPVILHIYAQSLLLHILASFQWMYYHISMICASPAFPFSCGPPRLQPTILPQLCLFRLCWIPGPTVSIYVLLFSPPGLLIFGFLSPFFLLPLLFITATYCIMCSGVISTSTGRSPGSFAQRGVSGFAITLLTSVGLLLDLGVWNCSYISLQLMSEYLISYFLFSMVFHRFFNLCVNTVIRLVCLRIPCECMTMRYPVYLNRGIGYELHCMSSHYTAP